MFSSANTATAALRVQLEQLGQLARPAEQMSRPRALPTGRDELDALLPGGGWPVGALIELLADASGLGELQLLLPALAQLAGAGRCIAWIAPPYLPYVPALTQQSLPPERLLIIRAERPQESLWATEQALRCPAVGAVLGWTTHIVDRNLRRLQLAAQAGGTVGILHRPAAAADEASPAALRLRLRPAADGLSIEVRKARGGRAGTLLQLSRTSLEGRDAVAVYSFAGAGA